MKKITFFIVTILCFHLGFSQDIAGDEIKLVQDLFGLEKKDIIAENINLAGVDANAFWALYDEYEASRKEIGQKKLELLYQYTTQEGAVTNVQAESLLSRSMAIRASEDNLIAKFTKKLKKSTSPLVASQFYQIEHYISDGIRYTILDNIDFIQDKK